MGEKKEYRGCRMFGKSRYLLRFEGGLMRGRGVSEHSQTRSPVLYGHTAVRVYNTVQVYITVCMYRLVGHLGVWMNSAVCIDSVYTYSAGYVYSVRDSVLLSIRYRHRCYAIE